MIQFCLTNYTHMPQGEEAAVVRGSSTGMGLEEEAFIALFINASTRFS
jgi:hypothetical protein